MDLRKVRFAIDPYLLLLLGLSLFALTPLLAPGYFYSAHDGRHSVFFVTMFDEAIRDGALWPRWAMHHNQGYGFPTFVIQAPLAFYVAEIFVLLGLGITLAVKLAWAVGFLASGWGMYALVRHWLTETVAEPAAEPETSTARRRIALAALAAGLLYVYAPYHLLDIYVRAAFAETMLMAWLPWAFLAFDRLIGRGSGPGWQGRLLLAGVSFAGLLLTHAFALLAITPLLVAFVLFRLGSLWPNRERPWDGFWPRVGLAAAAGIAALLLAAIFLLPLLAEGPLLAQEDWVRDTYDFQRHWVYWSQFLSPFWGYGYSDDPLGAADGMGFQIGLFLVVLALGGVYLLAVGRWRRWGLPLFLLLATAAVLFMMTPGAAWLWRSVEPLSVLQFPWRLLTLASFPFSGLAGLVIWQIDRGERLAGAGAGAEMTGGAGVLLLGLLAVFASLTYSRPQALQPIEPWREDGRAVFEFEQAHPDMLGYTNLVEERFTQSPMTPQYAASDFSGTFSNQDLERLGILAGQGEILAHYSRGQSFGGRVRMASAGVVQVRVFDFPGWQVRLDGQPVAHRVSPPYGLIELDVPPGEHQIDVRMGGTPARTTGAALSGLTLLGLAGLWGVGRVTRRRE